MANTASKIVISAFLTLFLLAGTISCFAQNEVKISTKKTIIDGKQFYIHTVKKGETLIAISKAYNVLQKDIVMENPTALDGLKPESTLKIPVFEDRSKYTYYIVEKGQTLYSIAKKFNIGISEVQKHNPAVANGLKVGMEIKIPKKIEEINKNAQQETEKNIKSQTDEKKEVNKETSVKENNQSHTHIVEKGETIYSLTKKYKISESQLYEANPDLQNNGLKVGTILQIPDNTSDSKKSIVSENEKKVENKETQNNTSKSATENNKENNLTASKDIPCNTFDFSLYKKPFRIALLAPFYITQNRGYVLKGKKKDEEPPIYPKSIKFIEFYQGMLLALDSLKKAGISTEVLVYDTEKDSTKIATITQKKEFENLDLIIGPFFSTNLKHFSDFAIHNNVPIISPLSQSSDFLQSNPVAFQINPSNNTQVIEAANYFTNSKDINYIVIISGKKEDSLLAVDFKQNVYKLYNEKFKTDPPKFKELKYKTVGFKGVQEALDKEIDNVIFIPATGETFVANVLNKLNTLETKYPIYMLGMQSWHTEDNIEQDYLFNLQYTYFTSMHVDYSRNTVSNFVSKYRNTYSADPTKYSFQGYDIMMYFINALKTYGKNFPNCIMSDTLNNKCGLQTEFLFHKQNEKSGFENTKTFLIQYDKEFNISLINGEKKEEQPEEKIEEGKEEKKE